MSQEIPLGVEGRKRLEDLIKQIWDFTTTPVHNQYVKSTQRQMNEVLEEILDPNVIDPYRLAQLKGQHEALKISVTLFEDTAANLEARVQAQLDLENQTQQNEE